MTIWLWVGFLVFVLLALAFDLFVAHRDLHAISVREALRWTVFWIALALGFNVLIYFLYEHHLFGIGKAEGQQDLPGLEAAILFFTGYVIEKSLSLDNIFVIALIFAHFKVEDRYQHRVLFWGILGALVLRGVMIWAGGELIHRFDWVMYVFGAVLLATAVKMMLASDDHIDPERNILIRLARKMLPVSPGYEGERFFTVHNGRRAVTPLFLVLLVVESTDVLFAVDSIPAIFAVTTDRFLVFTSNVFAILGLRSLYFALAGLMGKFRYLKFSLVFLLAYIGVKMLVVKWMKVPTLLSLAVIVCILSIGIIASLIADRRDRRKSDGEAIP